VLWDVKLGKINSHGYEAPHNNAGKNDTGLADIEAIHRRINQSEDLWECQQLTQSGKWKIGTSKKE
jgi:hypothetical protein